MPAEGNLGSNSIERSVQIVGIQFPVILLIVQVHYLLQERDVGDLSSSSLNDHHFVPTLQVDRDGWPSSEILGSKRTRAKIEGRIEPDTPYRAAVRLTMRTGRRDPIGACPGKSLGCPLPRKLPRSDMAAKHTRLAGLWVNAPSWTSRSEEHTSELQSRLHLVCRLL